MVRNLRLGPKHVPGVVQRLAPCGSPAQVKGGTLAFFFFFAKNFFVVDSLCSFICLQAVYQLSVPEY